LTTTTLTFAGCNVLLKPVLVLVAEVSDFLVFVGSAWTLGDPTLNDFRVRGVKCLPRQVNQRVVNVAASAANNLRHQTPSYKHSFFPAGRD
jgi:hypothetical protein